MRTVSRRLGAVVVIALTLAAAVPGVAWAAEPDPSDRLQANDFEVEITVQANYLLYLPPEYDEQDAWPLLIFLHGAGERGSDLNEVKAHGPPKLIGEGKDYPFLVLAPQCESEERWQPKVLIELIDRVANTHKVDKDRIYLTGLSMGGYGCWRLAAEYPKVFAAVAPICGGGNSEKAPRLKDIPIWAFHGGADKTVEPKRSREMVDAVNEAGGQAKLTLYGGVGHDSWTETYDNPEFYQWLLGHDRK